jgi:hypothetical protein
MLRTGLFARLFTGGKCRRDFETRSVHRRPFTTDAFSVLRSPSAQAYSMNS